MKLREIAANKENWIYAGSQMAVGILNYAFQILAARQLSGTDFGRWSGWFASFSFALFVALWLQSLTTIQRSLPVKINTVTAWAVGIGLAGASVFATLVGYEDVMGWLWMIVFSALFGLALAYRQLILAAVASIAIPLGKFATVYYFSTYEGYKWAVLFSPALACLIYLLFFSRLHGATTSTTELKRDVALSSLFLSMAAALIPQLDLLSAQALLNHEELGNFAKVALIYKGIFFFLMIILQVLLTYQVRGTSFRFSPLNIASLYVMGILGALILPYLRLFGPLSPIWISGAVIHILSLSLLFFLIQQETSQQRWPWPAVWTALLGLEYGVARIFSIGLVNYWVIGVIVETLIMAGFLLKSRQKLATT